jgi:tetratricopeptide (TPR) repeat protein
VSRIYLVTLCLFCGSAFAQNGGDFALVLHAKGRRAAESGYYDAAQRFYAQQLTVLLANGREAEAGEVYDDLAEVMEIQGFFVSAEATYKKAIDLLKHYAQPNDMRLVTALDNLGWMYVTWGRTGDATRLIGEARTKADGVPPDDPGLIGHLDTQAAFHVALGRYSEAEKNWNRALEIGKINYGQDSPQYDAVLVHFGQASVLFGDYNTAERMFRRYLAIEESNSSVSTAE